MARRKKSIIWDVGGLCTAVETMLGKPETNGRRFECETNESDNKMKRLKQIQAPLFGSLIHVNNSDEVAEDVDDGAAVQVCWRDVVLINRLSRYDSLVQLERCFWYLWRSRDQLND